LDESKSEELTVSSFLFFGSDLVAFCCVLSSNHKFGNDLT
jgi:hypothetical protein